MHWLVCFACLAVNTLAATGPDFPGLLRRQDWFGLRDAAALQPPPALYAGALAVAFHRDAEALRILREYLAGSPKAADAGTARYALADLDARAGRYRSALDDLQPLLARHPRRRDLLEAQSFFSALGAQGDLAVAAREPVQTSWDLVDGNLFVPATVNGAAGKYLLDTGANISVVSVSEARRLGLTVQGSGSGKDYAGNRVPFQTAVAAEFRLGGIVLHHVAFGVVPDAQQPFAGLPVGRRGILGIPILLAAQTWRWTKDGKLEAGFASTGCGTAGGKSSGNLAFAGSSPVLRAEYGAVPLVFSLDTGATATNLWPLFARRYSTRLSSRGKVKIEGVGGSRQVAGATLAEFALAIGDRTLRLKNVKVETKTVSPGSRERYGNLGLDLLAGASRVTLDFAAMCLAVE
jgi:hypothetical protein